MSEWIVEIGDKVADVVHIKKMVPLVRCKDCKHYPEEDHGYIRFPDDVCPCKCDDDYYNRVPQPEWFCANGEKVTE